MRIVTVPAAGEPELLAIARTLMGEYGAMPHIEGRWLTIDEDLAALPNGYVAPLGALLVVMDGDEPLGCGALAPFAPPEIAELKRVYVRPAARGRGIGELLTRALMTTAANVGYTRVRLDTAPELDAAIALYRRLGFVEIPAYKDVTDRPFLFFERTLP